MLKNFAWWLKLINFFYLSFLIKKKNQIPFMTYSFSVEPATDKVPKRPFNKSLLYGDKWAPDILWNKKKILKPKKKPDI